MHCTATTLIWLPSQAGAQSGGLSKPSHPPTEADTWLHSCAHSARVCGSDWLHPPALQHQQQQQCRAPQKCTSGTSLKTGRRLNVHPSSSLPSSLPLTHKCKNQLVGFDRVIRRVRLVGGTSGLVASSETRRRLPTPPSPLSCTLPPPTSLDVFHPPLHLVRVVPLQPQEKARKPTQ